MRRAELYTRKLIITEGVEHLCHAEDDVGVLAALVGVYALPVVPEQISTG